MTRDEVAPDGSQGGEAPGRRRALRIGLTGPIGCGSCLGQIPLEEGVSHAFKAFLWSRFVSPAGHQKQQPRQERPLYGSVLPSMLEEPRLI